MQNQDRRYTAYSPADAAYNEFLFALVGDADEGMPLTVASLLGRQGLDPWEEAARLAGLAPAAAAAAFRPVVARGSPGGKPAADISRIADRLVRLLPKRSQPPRAGAIDRNRPAMILIYVLCAALALGYAVDFLADSGASTGANPLTTSAGRPPA